MVGDLLVARAGKEALENLSDHRCPLRVGNEARLLIASLRPRRVGMRLMPKPVAVGRPPAVAVTLTRVLFLTAPNFATQLLDLELVERLEHVADQSPLGAGLVAGGERVEDLDPGPRHLALVSECVEEVAAEARGRVDDYRVEAPRIPLLGLAQQVGPACPVVSPTGLLIGEVADDLPVQLSGFRRAYLALGRKRERRVLLVLGREASVPGEASHQCPLP
ncbi:MAG TPA: hypothetical protein VHU86_10575 [Solirubrobacterales bacterium]|nr:hypothetical protein [Solirubrobacterales bacterium]